MESGNFGCKLQPKEKTRTLMREGDNVMPPHTEISVWDFVKIINNELKKTMRIRIEIPQ